MTIWMQSEARYSDYTFDRSDSGIVLYGVKISTGGNRGKVGDRHCYHGCQVCGAEWRISKNGSSASMSHAPWCAKMVHTLVAEEIARLNDVARRVVKRTKARWV